MAARNIFIVGLMAVGKTTVGRLLAESIHWRFLDSDQQIEERAGADIPWIFDVEGEAGFREREQSVIEELTQCNELVLATGGGAVLRPQNRANLAANGTVIHLHSTVDRLVERASKNKRRPLLNNGSVRQTLQRLQAEREPLYTEVADYSFLTDRQSPRALANAIERQLRDDGLLP